MTAYTPTRPCTSWEGGSQMKWLSILVCLFHRGIFKFRSNFEMFFPDKGSWYCCYCFCFGRSWWPRFPPWKPFLILLLMLLMLWVKHLSECDQHRRIGSALYIFAGKKPLQYISSSRRYWFSMFAWPSISQHITDGRRGSNNWRVEVLMTLCKDCQVDLILIDV